MKDAEQLPHACASGPLCSSLVAGIRWLKQASEAISVPHLNFKRCKLSDAEEVLADSQVFVFADYVTSSYLLKSTTL